MSDLSEFRCAFRLAGSGYSHRPSSADLRKVVSRAFRLFVAHARRFVPLMECYSAMARGFIRRLGDGRPAGIPPRFLLAFVIELQFIAQAHCTHKSNIELVAGAHMPNVMPPEALRQVARFALSYPIPHERRVRRFVLSRSFIRLFAMGGCIRSLSDEALNGIHLRFTFCRDRFTHCPSSFTQNDAVRSTVAPS